MAVKNFYILLGVHRGESVTGIRAAYKDLAKKFHPDRIGEHGTRAFQEITEAYQTLSDPEKRRSHNRLLDQEEDRQKEGGQRIPVRQGLEPELLRWRKVSTLDDEHPAQPSFENLYHRVSRNFGGMGVTGVERAEGLNFEVLLSVDEARRGGVISVEVPTSYSCALCRGSGRNWMLPCFDCQGLGLIDTETTVNVRFPPWVRTGTVIEVPLREFGAESQHLRLHLVVD